MNNPKSNSIISYKRGLSSKINRNPNGKNIFINIEMKKNEMNPKIIVKKRRKVESVQKSSYADMQYKKQFLINNSNNSKVNNILHNQSNNHMIYKSSQINEINQLIPSNQINNKHNIHIDKLNQMNQIKNIMQSNHMKPQPNKKINKLNQMNQNNGSIQQNHENIINNLYKKPLIKSSQIYNYRGVIQSSQMNDQNNQMVKSGQINNFNQKNKPNNFKNQIKHKKITNQKNQPIKIINNQSGHNQVNHNPNNKNIQIKQSSSKNQKKPVIEENNIKKSYNKENMEKKSEKSNINTNSNQETQITIKKIYKKTSDNSNINNSSNKKNKKNEFKEKVILNNNINNNITPNMPISSSKKTVYVNLINEGNSSFIISCLYCLANSEKIKEYLLKSYKGNSITEIGITYFFWRILIHLKEKDKSEYNIESFYKNIINANKIFKTSKSAVDFLVFLLDKFHNEDKKFKKINQEIELKEDMYNNISKYKEYLKKYENSYIFNNYAWINQKIVKCLRCKHEIKTYTYYFTYDLNISSTLNKHIIKVKSNPNLNINPDLDLTKCFEYATDNEILYNVYCPSCDNKTYLERNSKIYSLSNYLIILLSGIEEENNMRLIKENNIKIKIDEKINIKKFDNSVIEYKINSIIYYDLNNKRYINYYLENKLWIKHDIDIKVENSGNFLKVFNYNIIPVIIFYELSNN